MSEAIGSSQNNLTGNRLEQDPYYKRLQTSLKEQASTQKQQAETQIQDTQKVVKATQTKLKETVDKQNSGDQVAIGSTKWVKGKDGEFSLEAQLKDTTPSSVNLKTNAKDILKFHAPKVDLGSKLAQMKQNYMLCGPALQ